MTPDLTLKLFRSGQASSQIDTDFNKIRNRSETNVMSFATKKTLDDLTPHIKKYANGDKPHEEIVNHWQRLLEDALLYLKINDRRENAYNFFDELDTSRRESDYSKEFRKHHCYGMPELTSYFKDFGNFEGLLFGSSERYRDHLVHPFAVWLTGILVLDTFGEHFGLQTCPNDLHVTLTTHIKAMPPSCDYCDNCQDKEADQKIEDKRDTCLYVSCAELGAMWTIIALTHDVGYPLEKVSSITDQIAKMMSHFGRGGFNKSDFAFQSQHIQSIRTLNRILSSKVSRVKNHGWKTSIRAKYFTKSANAWLSLEHGILGSYILLRKLTFFMEADYTVDDTTSISPEDARQLAIRSEILLAIAAHTNRKIYHLSPWSLSFLLILCDDLQEWGRPSFQELRYNSPVEIKNISLGIKLDPISNGADIDVIMEFSDKNLDQKDFINHCKRGIGPSWSERLRPGVGDAERKIKLSWTVKHGKQKFCVSINPKAEIQQQITEIFTPSLTPSMES